MRVSYSTICNGNYTSNDTILPVGDIVEVLKRQETLPKNHIKGKVGELFVYSNGITGKHHPLLSEGLLLVDIDGITIDNCEKIVNKFDELSLIFQPIIACWGSYSYYNQSKKNEQGKYIAGLHFALKCEQNKLVQDNDERLDNKEFFSYTEYNMWYSAMLAYYIFKICDVDVRPFHNNIIDNGKVVDKVCGLDSHLKYLYQRIFFNYVDEVKFNTNVFPRIITDENKKVLKEWFNNRPDKSRDTEWIVDTNYKSYVPKFKVHHRTYNEVISEINTTNSHLGYDGRWRVADYLASLNWKAEEILNVLLKISGSEDFKHGYDNYVDELKKIIEVGIRNYSNGVPDWIVEQAVNILEDRGVYFVKDYIDIEIPIDPIAEEVFNELKDKPVVPKQHVVVAKQCHKFNLKQNEYLSTVKNDLYDIISSYPVTCIFADCAVGKTHMSLDFKMDPQLDIFKEYFGIKDTSGVDICEPFNSVADSKVEGAIDRKDIERVRTSDVKRYSFNKKNVFIWDSLETIYNVHFNGLQKREVLFFDEAHKIITDKYRWATILKMMPLIKKMYKHVVFMTGTSVYEWKFFEQFWKKEEIGMVLVNKDRIHKLTGDVLVYKKFGDGDRRFLLETLLAENKLVQIYSNAENKSWRNIINKINAERKEYGIKEYKVLDYRRDNRDRLLNVNETGNIDNYDIVLGTAYLGVGVDFLPSEKDNRSRYVIIDLPGETNCTAQELWQFANRNRNQPFHLIIPVLEKSLKDKLYGSTLTIQQLTKIAKAKVGLNNIPNPEDTELTDTEALAHITNVIIQHSEFPEIVKFKKNNLYNQDVIVDLVTHYLGYVGRFCNTNMIIHYLKRRGVTVNVVNKEHITEGIDNTDVNTNFNWFVNNMEECITAEFHKDKYQYIYKYTDINNTMETNRIENGIIYATNPNYIRQLNKLVINDPSWRNVLKETAEKNEVMSMNFINAVQSIRYIVNNISKQELNKLKKLYEIGGNEVIESQVNEILKLLFGDIFTDSNKDQWELNKLKEKYTNILIFLTTIYNEIKNLVEHKEKNTLTAAIQIAAQLDIKNKTDKRKKQSSAQKKTIEVKNTKNGKVIKNVTTYEQLAEYLKITIRTAKNIIKDEKLQKKYNVKVIVL